MYRIGHACGGQGGDVGLATRQCHFNVIVVVTDADTLRVQIKAEFLG